MTNLIPDPHKTIYENGWFSSKNEQNKCWYCSDNVGIIRLKTDRAGGSDLKFTARSNKQDTCIMIRLNGRFVKKYYINQDEIDAKLGVAFKAGTNIIEFSKDEKAEGKSEETYDLKFMIKNLDFTIPKGLRKKPGLSKDIKDLLRSGLFFPSYYHQQNVELAYCHKSLAQHYLFYGAWENKNPNPLFDSAFYLKRNRDVYIRGVNPLLHFIRQGWKEGRNPHTKFKTISYFNENPDIKKQKINPLLHYLKYGMLDGLNPSPPPRISIEKFQEFTFSRRSHWDLFTDLAKELYEKNVNIDNCTLKVYQDLLVLTFINDQVPPGSRILDIGGGDSRILKHLSNTHDCWNIDKMEGMGNGPLFVKKPTYNLVKDYMGNFNEKLPVNSFDFVFSISALEHTPDNQNTFDNIIRDIDRVLKPNGFSLHLFDVLLKHDGTMWTNNFVYRIFETINTINKLVTSEMMNNDTDLYWMSEEAYNKNWKHTTKREYKEFGRPVSLNLLWQKPL